MDSDENGTLGVDSVYLTLPMLISKLWFILGMSGKLAGTKLRQQRLSFLGMHRHAPLHAEVAVLVPAANLPHACQEAPAHDSRLLIGPDMRYTLHVVNINAVSIHPFYCFASSSQSQSGESTDAFLDHGDDFTSQFGVSLLSCVPFLQVTEFAGKAAVPFSGMFKFQKAFFLHPKTDELYGRVQLQKGPLGNALYPLYYKASAAPSLVPGRALNCASVL